ncbi:MAG: nuclear transport factor 2 family protein [Lysobacter sp.]|nr:nuclear transport factor 2 family protein [Lysobacter sp.]
MRLLLLSVLLLPLCASAGETTPEQAVSALWRASSIEAGGRADLAVLQRLFHPDAVVFGGHYKQGAPSLRRWTGAEFLKNYQGVQERGFHECEVARTVHRYDGFAAVYSVVESRADPQAPKPDFVGVNSIQLYRDGAQWRVLSLYYHVEKAGLPIGIEGGRSGQCIG